MIDLESIDHIYLFPGSTDLRKGRHSFVKCKIILTKRECGHFIGPSFRILANIPLSLCSQALP